MTGLYVIACIAAAAAVLFCVYLCQMAPRRRHPAMLEQFLGRPYAHRGLHDRAKGVPENTLLAFERAAEQGYGMEFDVRFTKDRQLVIMHDNDLERMTGFKALTSETDLEQIGQLRIGGTDQPVPRFEQVLELVAGRVPLIIELKTCGDDYAELGDTVCRVLDGYDGPFVIESFDPRLVRWMRKNRPEMVRGQLMEYYRRHGGTNVPAILDFIIHSHIVCAWVRPDFIAINHADRDTVPMRLTRAVFGTPEFDWTVRSQAEADASRKDGSGYIFEGFIPSAHD